MVRRAIDFGFDLNVRVQRAFFDAVPLFEGGTFSNFAQWIPGRIVSESLDPYHMTSVAYFERWGREPAERILAAFDGGVIHIHGNGRHPARGRRHDPRAESDSASGRFGLSESFDVIRELNPKPARCRWPCLPTTHRSPTGSVGTICPAA